MFKQNEELQRKIHIVEGMLPAIGGVLTYQALRERLNEPVNSQHPALASVLERWQNQGLCFQNTPGIGYRRLNDREIAGLAVPKHRKKIYRAAKRGVRAGRAIKNWDTLTSEERNTTWANISSFRLTQASLHGSAIKARSGDRQAETFLDKELRRLRGKKDGKKE